MSQLFLNGSKTPIGSTFAQEISFQYKFPIDPTTLNKWRKKISSEGFEDLFKSTIEAGIKTGTIKKTDFEKVNVDTTVQEKEISFPTDSKLYHKMRLKLVKESKKLGILLRRTYGKASKKSLIMQGRYRHARQMKRAAKEVRSLRVMMGRVLRDLARKTKGSERSEKLQKLLDHGEKLFKQKRTDKNKIYSLHCPEVECIAKGKAHKKYEFGCKVGFATSSSGNFVIGAKAFHGNPFDGHTLRESLEQCSRLMPVGAKILDVFVDRGYKGHGVTEFSVHLDQKKKKNETKTFRKWLRRRSAIEPLIGHMKNDGGPKRNHLLGKQGDQINALMMAIGFNLRKIQGSFCLEFLAPTLTLISATMQTIKSRLMPNFRFGF